MPKIRPAPKADRQAFSNRLPKGQRPLFAQLGYLVDQHRTDLDWYHAVGRLVREMHDAIPASRRGKGWAAALAVALGVSPSLLQKATRFVQLYPTAKDHKPLQELGLDWTRLYLTFAVKGRKTRQAFQRQCPGRFPAPLLQVGNPCNRTFEGLASPVEVVAAPRRRPSWERSVQALERVTGTA